MDLCPEFLKFKPPNLSVYKNAQNLYEPVWRKKLKEVIRSKKLAENRFQRQKNTIFSKLTFIEKSCLKALLDKEFKRSATPHIKTHEKKLFNLWKKQSVRCPEAILNISKKQLTLKERNALRFGLNHDPQHLGAAKRARTIRAQQKVRRTKRAQGKRTQSKKGAEQKGREITMLRHRYIQGRNFFR